MGDLRVSAVHDHTKCSCVQKYKLNKDGTRELVQNIPDQKKKDRKSDVVQVVEKKGRH